MSQPHPTPNSTLETYSTPNIPASSAILRIQSATLINAPPSTVWSTLIDTSTWPTWNTFVPRVTIREQPDASTSPILQAGTKLTFHVRMDPSSTSEQDVPLIVTEFDPPSAGSRGRVVWASDFTAKGSIPAFLLMAERVHEFEEVEVPGENGAVETVTEVRTWERQVGYLVYAVRWMYGGKLQGFFENWVSELKGVF
ncbi:hypothetical protein BDV25DRAFT_148503 [Aspergillus avenaceus]|uniref:Coenzyme Q-binding protein COQ10 START domain-containing protein n=1 Tax=Aspergillus avenaceus TaxID=36643 RepID=A0A5N6U622_ASPAV|nr:hypothetical protein BDV25DRAFT_148503 [Aspergillus avenaceus]